MVSQLLQPPGDVLIGPMLGNVVHEQRADSASVVGRGDRPVSLLAGYVGLAGDGVDGRRDGGIRQLRTVSDKGAIGEIVWRSGFYESVRGSHCLRSAKLSASRLHPSTRHPDSRTDCVNVNASTAALTSVPDLSLDRLAVNVDTPRGKLDADRRL